MALLLLQATTTSVYSFQRVQAPFLPPQPPPPSINLQELAKSPASAQLASDFFALERQRGFTSNLPTATNRQASQLAGSTQVASSSPLNSQIPQYSSTLDGSLRLDEYHPLEEIYAYLDGLAKRYKNVQVFTIGRTTENRPIKALELVNNVTDSDYVWLDALTHAREWITGTTMLYIIDQLVAGRGKQRFGGTQPVAFTKNYIIVPVVNPDGYVYTWTTNRMWRKNRSRAAMRSPDSKCVGVSITSSSITRSILFNDTLLFVQT